MLKHNVVNVYMLWLMCICYGRCQLRDVEYSMIYGFSGSFLWISKQLII